MANYTTANLVKAQVALTGAFASADKRFRDPAVFKIFLAGSRQFFPNYETLRTREDRTLEANYFVRQARALGTGRSHNHTGTSGDSGVLTPSWTTYNDKFSLSLKQADNSIFSAQEEYNDKLMNVVANFAEGLDTLATNTLFSNRTGVNIALAEGTFNTTDDVYQIDETTVGNRAIQITKTVMDINKYSATNYVVACDSISFNKFGYLAAQGMMNATNTEFQFQGVSFVHAPELGALGAALAGAYADGFWLVIPEGTVGALPCFPKQNREGISTKENMYGAIMNPIDQLMYAIHSYEARFDGTATNGYTQDVQTQVEISIDMALEVAPLSVATASPIFAFAYV